MNIYTISLHTISNIWYNKHKTNKAGTKMKKIDFPNFLSVKEVAKILGVSNNIVYREVEEGAIKSIKIRGSYKIFEDELDGYIKSHIFIGFNNPNKQADIRAKRKYGRSANRT